MKKLYLVLFTMLVSQGVKAQTVQSVFEVDLLDADSIISCDENYSVAYELKLLKDTSVFINSLYVWTPNFHYEEDEGYEIEVGSNVSSGHSFGIFSQTFNSSEVQSLFTMDTTLTYGPFVEGDAYFSFVEIYDSETALYDILLYKIYWCNDGTTTSVKALSHEDLVSLAIYPNPADNKLNISFDFKKSTSVFIAIYDVTGRVLLEEHIGSVLAGQSQKVVDIQSLATGSYILKVWNSEFSKAEKFAKGQ